MDSWARANCVHTADVDSDGDTDLLGTASLAGEVAWFENDLYGFRFIGDPTSGHAPLTVQFTDLSAADPALTYRAWDFDNNGVVDSEGIAPTCTYENPGIYFRPISEW